MIILDHPPAIIIPRPVTPFRFIVNDGKEHDCGPCLPRDFASMPRILRASVAVREIRPYLPEPYRRLSDGMILSLVANIGGLPGVLMAGGIKTATLYPANGTFAVPGDWNPNDNIIQGVGSGGRGQTTFTSSFFPGEYYGGSGGGGAAWAALINAVLTPFNVYTLNVATSPASSTWFDSIATLLAVGGSDGAVLVGGSAAGGPGGDKASCVGNQKNSGGDGQGTSGHDNLISGGHGGGAGGPHGDGDVSGNGDAGFGGLTGVRVGALASADGGDGVDGPAGGWNPGAVPNAGSGAGGGAGIAGSGSGVEPDGHDGGDYGAGAGGAGVVSDPFVRVGSPGTPSPGCLLIINNASL